MNQLQYPQITDLIKRIHQLVGPNGETPVFKTVGGTGSLQRILTQEIVDQKQLPAIYVTPGTQTASPTKIMNAVSQPVRISYFVVIVLPMSAELTGLNQTDDAEKNYIAAAHWAVLGARTGEGRLNGFPILYSNGEPYIIDNARYSYKLEYYIDVLLSDQDHYSGTLEDLKAIEPTFDIKITTDVDQTT
ncbi:hypothetical protein HK22_02145 [Gluconobacter sp. DsW_056]|uniref:hypothetical protein n=1 Tax=Gluconobacter sp. DsW_056 TaxID=1511209 RepID=UPI000A3B97C9|nr:hypothetical protein [Gluconobacter sp. DsW_056]OUI81679.1 hypothetical protein HK22_02145 [Gluconobacter sp. DsW_056]